MKYNKDNHVSIRTSSCISKIVNFMVSDQNCQKKKIKIQEIINQNKSSGIEM